MAKCKGSNFVSSAVNSLSLQNKRAMVRLTASVVWRNRDRVCPNPEMLCFYSKGNLMKLVLCMSVLYSFAKVIC